MRVIRNSSRLYFIVPNVVSVGIKLVSKGTELVYWYDLWFRDVHITTSLRVSAAQGTIVL